MTKTASRKIVIASKKYQSSKIIKQALTATVGNTIYIEELSKAQVRQVYALLASLFKNVNVFKPI